MMMDYIEGFKELGVTPYPVSCRTGEGVQVLIKAVFQALKAVLEEPSSEDVSLARVEKTDQVRNGV
jgi:hypothetical protein